MKGLCFSTDHWRRRNERPLRGIRGTTLLVIAVLLLCSTRAKIAYAQPKDQQAVLPAHLRVSCRARSSVMDCKEAATSGDIHAMYLLGGFYENGHRVSKDPVAASKWYRMAAHLGSLPAMNRMGEIYQDGDGGPENNRKATFWYRKAARRGSAKAMNHLGMLSSYTRGFPTNYPVALYWFRRAARRNNSDAMNNLGLMYFEARGVPRDYDQARKWWTRASARNNTAAMGDLGWLYQLGLGVPKDLEKAIQLYERAAVLGNCEAFVKLGLLYENGTGVPKDLDKAVEYLEKAAGLNDTSAMYALGEIHEGLHGGPRDAAKAKSWYERAASTLKGSGSLTNTWPAEWAMGRLAGSYESGSFTEQDFQLAMQWYQKLAALNDPNAMDRIAYLYSHGLGVPKDEAEARKWNAKAAALRPPPKPKTPDCTDQNLETKLRIFSLPDSQVVALERRNKTSAACALGSLELKPNEVAHTSRRWRTLPSDGIDASCKSDIDNSFLNGILLVSSTLLPQVCSEIQTSAYATGPFIPDWPAGKNRVPPAEPKLTLSATRQQYLKGERVPLHVEMTSDDAATPRTKQGCPVLLRSVTYPSGFTRVDEMTPTTPMAEHNFRMVKSCSGTQVNAAPSTGFEFDGTDQLDESSSSTIRFFTLAGSMPSGEIRLIPSNSIPIDFKNPADLPRTWGVTEQGVRVDLTLDKTQFQVGEDIAAHIAIQVVEAQEPVYGEPFVRDGAFFHSIAGGFHLSISDKDGPLENTDRRANLYGPSGGSSGPSVCPGPLGVGKVIPLERSLRDFGLLPTRPGTYQLSVTWSPYHSRFLECPSARPDPPEEPFVTVTSNPVTISVVGSQPTSKLPPYPEYTAWKEHFRLVDTSFGPLTALLDEETGLEWLRPTFTQDSNVPVTERSLTDRMTREKAFAEWRFATMDEVRSFLAHFTGTPDGISHDPSVERKLLRLLGGTIKGTPDQQSGWIDNRISILVAGHTPAPAERSPDGSILTCGNCGPGFWFHYTFIREGVKDGHVEADIKPDLRGKTLEKQSNGYLVFEGGTVHYAGFFLVRKRQAMQRYF